jgi:DNA adenine methylase
LRTVLKYPGSKWNIVNNLISIIPEHHSYVEPFFGSGALFFSKKPSDIEMINDMDNDVVNLFTCIRNDSERLARLVMCVPFSRNEYDKQFEILEEPTDEFEKAVNFLIKCWQGHGFRTNGYKVGWKNDVQGRERMYALWNWYRLPEWIIEIAERLRAVQIENRPAVEVIKRFNYSNVFMYLDPPYILGTRTAKQYKYEMANNEHEELLATILQSKAKILISGYDSELYNDMLSGWFKKSFDSNAEYGLKRKEIVWANYEIEPKQISLFG